MTFSHKDVAAFRAAVLALGILVLFGIFVHAASKADIVFPVKELNGCQNQAECRTWCDQPENSRVCLVFVKKYNLASEDEIKKWEKFIDVVANGGPGGCRSEAECIKYCEDSSRIVECTAFVEKYDLVSPEQLAEMKKVSSAVKAGVNLPGNCHNKAECFLYCQSPANLEECFNFAQKAGFIASDELPIAKKVLPLMMKGETPGKCQSKEDCESYCADDSHFDECITFAEKIGVVNKEHADLVRKTKGKSPGDCAHGKRGPGEAEKSCEEFCAKPENEQTCIAFAKEYGLISPEESTYIDRLQDFKLCYDATAPEIQACFKNALGQETLDKLLVGRIPMDSSLREKFVEAHKCVADSNKSVADLRKLPPEMISCLKEKMGPDILITIETANVSCVKITPLKKAMDECQADMKAQFENKIRTCTAQPCEGMLGCLRELPKGSKENQNQEFKLPADVQGKIDACVAEMQSKNKGPQEGSAPSQDQQPQQNPEPTQYPASGQYPQSSQIPQEYCSGFSSVPNCSYVGTPDSDNYKYCKQCFPDK